MFRARAGRRGETAVVAVGGSSGAPIENMTSKKVSRPSRKLAEYATFIGATIAE